MTISMNDLQIMQNKATCLHDMQAINAALDRMAVEITQELQDQQPIVMTVLNGSIIPVGHLVTRLHFPLQLDYLHVTRYQGKMHASQLHWLAEPRSSLKDRVILIVEDVLDAGTTLAEIIKYCEAEGAAKIYTAVVVDKNHPRAEGGLAHADFTGLKVEDLFLIGFGLDYEGYFRNLPGIYAVTAAE
ncbi:MAG: hypoxanthine-guanine phosphoribosyltransferase [Gammaproteobacteria bacterium]|nr:hypoxanthine-guanine phosphoribosyltransferase [Gammaproteobacteria bacterium]